MGLLEKPYTVTAPGGKTHLVVMNATDGLPAAFALMGTRAEKKVAIRIAGGCKGMTEEDKAAMIAYFATAFRGFRGVVWSGGTRKVDEGGMIDPMVTDLPGFIARNNPGCVALGSLPRTALLRLQGESRLVLDDWGTVPNPDAHGILIVQNGPDGALDWDGDVDQYFRLMDNWAEYAGFTALGMIAWNGGEITKKEVLRAAKKGWPTILVGGSGRATDELVKQILNSDDPIHNDLPNGHKLRFVRRSHPNELSGFLTDYGFFS